MASSRLPGKVLADIEGVPMVVRVLRQVEKASLVSRALVATDSEQVAAVVRDFGGQVVLTSDAHRTGTDRIAEAAAGLPGDLFVNIQGDEPLIEPTVVDRLVAAFADPTVDVVTASAPLLEDQDNPSRVKVVVSNFGRALYFSRVAIPFGGPWRLHVGVYGFRRRALAHFATMPQSELERIERLEQLRFLESGLKIQVVEVDCGSISVDTEPDLRRVRGMVRARS